jgi:hypothetical protein
MPVEALAGCREFVPASLALERFQADGILEPRVLARHCRGCDIEAAAGLPDREIFANRAELTSEG